jgi:hypothetical protein
LTPEELQKLRDSIVAQVRESVLAELATSRSTDTVEPLKAEPVQQSRELEVKPVGQEMLGSAPPEKAERELHVEAVPAKEVSPAVNVSKSSQFDALEEELKQIRAEVEAMRQKVAEGVPMAVPEQPTGNDAALQALMDKLNKLDERLHGLESAPVASRSSEPALRVEDTGNQGGIVSDEISGRLSSLEAGMQALTLKLEAVSVPRSAPATREKASAGRSRSGSKDVPQCVEELRAELMKFMEAQIASLKASMTQPQEDVLTERVEKLRLELTSLLQDQVGKLRSQVSVDMEKSPDSESPTAWSIEITDTVTKAVDDLRKEVSTQLSALEEQLGSYQGAQSPGGSSETNAAARQQTPVRQQAPDRQQTAVATQEVAAQTSKPETPLAPDEVKNAEVTTEAISSRPTSPHEVVGQLRRDLFQFLEDQMKDLRKELAKVSAQHQRSIIAVKQEMERNPGQTSEQEVDAPAPSAAVAETVQPPAAQSPTLAQVASDTPSSRSDEASDEFPGQQRGTFIPATGNIEDVIRFFQGQLDDIRRMAIASREDAVKKASNALRQEVRGWADQELIDMQMKIKAGLDSNHETDTGNVQFPAPTEISEEWFAIHLPEIAQKLCRDEMFTNLISQRCKNMLGPGSEPSPANSTEIKKELHGVVDGSKRADMLHPKHENEPLGDAHNASLLGGLLGPGRVTIAQLDTRLHDLEKKVTMELEERRPSKQVAVAHSSYTSEQQSPRQSNEPPPDFLSLMEVHDDLRRLKTRLEYLERMAPPEVQKQLAFFDPLHEDGTHAPDPEHHQGGQAAQLVGSSVMMRKLQELQASQDSELDDLKYNSDEARREVANLSRALRGVQRDGEVHGSKLLDIQKSLAEQQKRLEVALPELLQSLEGLLGSKRKSGGEPDVAAGLRALLQPEGDSNKAPFVSQNGLSQALETLQGQVQTWLSKLQEDIMNLLRNKADADLVKAIMDRLEEVQSSSPMIHIPDQGVHDGPAALMRVPMLQGRCVSCDAPIGLRMDEQPSWPKQKQKPSPPWPQRGNHVVPPPQVHIGSIRPLHNWPVVAGSQIVGSGDSDMRPKPTRPFSGTNVRRVESLPALPHTPDSSERPLR